MPFGTIHPYRPPSLAYLQAVHFRRRLVCFDRREVFRTRGVFSINFLDGRAAHDLLAGRQRLTPHTTAGHNCHRINALAQRPKRVLGGVVEYFKRREFVQNAPF